MRNHNYYVYIMAKGRNSTFYVGVTNDLDRRSYEHKHGLNKGFTKRYNIKKLVYYEHHTDIEEAIYREKKIKRWKRTYKMRLIESMNPNWDDLFENIYYEM